MDPYNSSHSWGYSGSIELISGLKRDDLHQRRGTCNLLQISPYDLRHTLTTVCRSSRDVSEEPVNLYIYEDNAAALARHLLLLALFLDGNLCYSIKMQRFLEVFGNHFLREDTFEHVKHKCDELEELLSHKIAQGSGHCLSIIDDLVDISLLKYESKDAVLSAIVEIRSHAKLDMKSAWDFRCRKWYGDRYDFRRNMIDWDYHMRLLDSKPVPAPQSIVHFSHFRHWRMSGIAFEVRDCQYTVPNQSLLSTASGRTKEFKDRNCNDVGRSVTAHGLWSDIICSPYHSFGTACEDLSYFKVSNNAFKYTAVDVSERNILALLHELYTGHVPEASELRGESVHRARPARGPTTAQDLKDAMQGQTHDSNMAASSMAVDAAVMSSDSSVRNEDVSEVSGCRDASAQPVQQECENCLSGDNTGAVGHVSSMPAQNEGTSPEQLSPKCEKSPPGEAVHDKSMGVANTQEEMDGHVEDESATQAAMNAAAARRLRRFKIFLVTGDFEKQLTGRRALAGKFSGATVGAMHSHLLRKSHKLVDVLAPGARVLVESAKNILQVPKECLPAFHEKVIEWAAEGGLQHEPPTTGECSDVTSIADHIAFVKSAAPVGG